MNLAQGHNLEALLAIALGLWLTVYGSTKPTAATAEKGEIPGQPRHWGWRVAGVALLAGGALVLGGLV